MKNNSNILNVLAVEEPQLIVRFKNLNSNLYLTCQNAGTEGHLLTQQISTGYDDEKWVLEYNRVDDTFIIRPKYRQIDYITPHGEKSYNGNLIVLWNETPSKWKFEYDEEYDAHRIVSEFDGYSRGISVKDDSKEPGVEVVMWDKKDAVLSDRWIIDFL